jgi:hypothetical protein
MAQNNMPTSPAIWFFVVGMLIFFAAALKLIYKGRRGNEASLRRGADMAIWAVVLVAGIYIGMAMANDLHVYARVELLFNGVLVATLVIMRWQEVSQRLALAILLIGVHGLWNVLHLFNVPIANDLIPKWFAWTCGLLDLGYFISALPIFTAIVKSGRTNTNQPAQ